MPGFEHFLQHRLDHGHEKGPRWSAGGEKFHPIHQSGCSVRCLPKFVQVSPKWERPFHRLVEDRGLGGVSGKVLHGDHLHLPGLRQAEGCDLELEDGPLSHPLRSLQRNHADP